METEEIIKAKKDCKCALCNQIIKKGTPCVKQIVKEVSTGKNVEIYFHKECSELSNNGDYDFDCDFEYYVWECYEEHVVGKLSTYEKVKELLKI